MSDTQASAGRTPGGPAGELLELWRQGQRPAVEVFLARTGPLPPVERLAVLLVDQQQRWRAGDEVLAETYLRAHPDVAADPDLVVELVAGEYLLREEAGDPY